MKHALFALTVALVSVAAVRATPARAQARVFVAAQGSDANPCTFAAPCRTFQHAHDVVVAGGEIDVLDPAGYGAVNITKAISIQGHNFSGISTPSGGTAITINAGANDKINLSGLIIEGAGIGVNGILFQTGKSLVIENCRVRNLSNIGIQFYPTISSSLAVSDTLVAEVGSTAIHVKPNGTDLTVLSSLNRVGMYNNDGNGLFLDGVNMTGGFVRANVTDSLASNNKLNSFIAKAVGPHSWALMLVTRSVAEYSDTAFWVESNDPNGAYARIGISGNTTYANKCFAQVNAFSKIDTFKDNTIYDDVCHMPDAFWPKL